MAPSYIGAQAIGAFVQEARQVGDEFLALEKYVNLNYLVSQVSQTQIGDPVEGLGTGNFNRQLVVLS